MSSSDIRIYDYYSLVQLNESIDYCADSLQKIIRSVNGYLESIVNGMESQLSAIKDEVDSAKERLDNAEDNLAECERNQEWDEEEKEYRPSCSCEQSCLAAARRDYEEVSRKYEDAQRIVSSVKYEIDEYHKPRGVIMPGGAESTLKYLAEEHSASSTKKMDAIIEVIEEYLGARASISGRVLSQQEVRKKAEDIHMNNAQKAEEFMMASEKIRKRQKEESSSHNISDADTIVICPGCHRPIPICRCARTRER